MTTTATTTKGGTMSAHTVTYRTTKSGEWVVYGPASLVRVGTVTVTTGAGATRSEQVERLGRTFDVHGIEMVYGYLGRTERTQSAEHGAQMCEECGERKATTTAYDASGISGRVCGRCANYEPYERSFA